MIIGIDCDNTVACYAGVFHRAAIAQGLIGAQVADDKGSVRDDLRSRGKEDEWTRLQGFVYGPGMIQAVPYPGVLEFIKYCSNARHSVSIISHRTQYPYLGEKHDLHLAARAWLRHQGLHAIAKLPIERCYFELTKEAKLDRIQSLKCDVFIDDLPEFLADSGFPKTVRRILFDPHNRNASEARFERLSSWGDAKECILLGEAI